MNDYPSEFEPKIRKLRKVARGEINTFQQRKELFAFCTEITPRADELGRWIVDLECLDASWFLNVWLRDLAPNGVSELARIVGRAADFDEVFFGLDFEERLLMFDLHMRFTMRAIDEGDPAPTSLVQVVLLPDQTDQKFLRASYWYRLVVAPPEPHDVNDDPGYGRDNRKELQAVYTELGFIYENDRPPERRQILDFARLPPLMDSILKALHLPQWDPRTEPGEGARVGSGEPRPMMSDGDLDWYVNAMDEEPLSDSDPDSDTPVYRSVLHRVVERLRRFGEDWLWPPLLPPPAVAGGAPFPGRMPLRAPGPEPIRYHARPLAPAPMLPLAQVADPMNGGGVPHQEFIGVFNIGQGNLNALYDTNGIIIAYYDFGWPKPTEAASAPAAGVQFAPCLHDDPLMIISHWDFDHYAMSRRLRTSWDLRWIAPQQHVSATALQVYGRVIAAASGEMHIWPALAAGQHLRMPWGYLERGTGPAPLGAGGTNDSGIVAYVCVRPAPAAVAMAAGMGIAAVAAAPLLPRAPAAIPAPALAKPRAVAADAAATANVHLHDQVLAISEATVQVCAQFGLLPGAPWVVPAATIAAGRLTATQPPAGSAWAHALLAMANVGGAMAGGNPITAAAALLVPVIVVGWPPASATAAAAVTANAMAVAALAPPAAGTLEAAVAIADAAEALVPLPGGPPPWGPLVLANAGAAVQAMVNARAGAVVVPMIALAPAPAGVLAAVNANALDASVNAVAKAVAGAAAEAHAAMGAVGALPSANASARAAALAVARASLIGTAQTVLHELALGALGGGGAVFQAGTAVQMTIGGPGAATMAARIAAAPGPVAALALPVGGHHRAVLAAAVAAVDAALTARVSIMNVGFGVLAAAAAAAGVGGLSAAQAAAVGERIQQREVTAAARAAAREVVLAMGFAMQPVAAPLAPAGGGMGVLPGVPAGPGAAGAMPAPMLPVIALAGLIAGAAPTLAAERYVLLTGDVAFEYIPSQAVPAVPLVVGLTATHHGADTCFPSTSATSHIPYATGSPSAAAAAAAFASRGLGAATRVQTMAAAAAFWGAHVAIRAREEPLTATIAFADVATLAGLAHGAGAAGWAGALAAIAGAAGAPRHLNGIAAALGANAGATCAGAIAANAGRTAAALVTAIAVQRLLPVALANGIAITAANVTAGAVAAAPGGAGGVAALAGGAGVVAASMPAAVANVITSIFISAGVGLMPAAAHTLAATAVAITANEWRRAVVATAVVAALADARVAVVAAGVSPFSAPSSVGAHPAAAAVDTDAIALGLMPGGLAAFVEKITWPGTAPGFVGMDWRFTRVGSSSTEASVDAHAAGHAADATRAGNAATAAATAIRSEKLAISYGVHNMTFQHYFGPLNFRHPTPIAIAEYSARGWTSRRNTSVNAWQGAQPDPWTPAAGPAGAFVAGDNIAMGWEHGGVYEGPLRGAGGILNRSCPLCGVTHFVCC